MLKFSKFCSTISGLDRDNFNKELLEEVLMGVLITGVSSGLGKARFW